MQSTFPFTGIGSYRDQPLPVRASLLFLQGSKSEFSPASESWKLSLMYKPLFSEEAVWPSCIDRLQSLDLLQNGNQAKE